MSIWNDTDEPVVRWLAAPPAVRRPWILTLTLRPEAEPAEELDGTIDTREFDDALVRLRDHGLVAGDRGETIGYATWSKLRVTGLGLQVIGAWPDLDRLASAAGMAALLDQVADGADAGDDRRALRRAAGLVGQVGEGIVMKTLESAGEEIAKDIE